eukprot:4847168-Amphidinium_carterae.1
MAMTQMIELAELQHLSFITLEGMPLIWSASFDEDVKLVGDLPRPAQQGRRLLRVMGDSDNRGL